ncbi:hypothetical protein Tco_1424881 [Tanacetum coccineum]
MIVESLKEENMYVKFSNNVEAEHRGSNLDVEGIKWKNGVKPMNEFEIVYDDDLGLLLQPELPEYKLGRITKDIVVKLPSAITGGSELNGSNLIQETTNKIVDNNQKKACSETVHVIERVSLVISGKTFEISCW